ncbi:MAG TPA: hypothetical protein DGN60_07265 [Chloroflexi bacterium]|nr:hypothetical protein [Chloroflexota bacterium]|tara:strand:- start:69 stop:536 length:468 start_codon:yes stop_codon:yes gene_type:complete
MTNDKLTLLERRTLEAQAIAPIIRAFTEVVGIDTAKEVLQKVNKDLGRESGCQLTTTSGNDSLMALAEEIATWSEDGSLEVEITEKTDRTYIFNVTRCKFAEKYEELGVRDLGYALSCCRDMTFVEGYNPKIKLRRTQTIMEGNSFCDFHYVMEE